MIKINDRIDRPEKSQSFLRGRRLSKLTHHIGGMAGKNNG